MLKRDVLLRTATDEQQRSVTVPTVRVTVTPPEGPEVEETLGLTSLVVGSSPECDLVVKRDSRVSRQHCMLTLTGQGIVVKDLESKNGTFIRGVGVHEALLSTDTSVVIGSSRLVAREVGPPSVIALSTSERFGRARARNVLMRKLFEKLE